MSIRRRPRAGDERGAAAVEFAIVATLLFMLIFGIINFGLLWSQKNVYVGAAREGARFAAVRCGGTCGSTSVRDRTVAAAAGYPINSAGIVVDVEPYGSPDAGCTSNTAGRQVKVSWIQPMQVNLPLLPRLNLNVPIEAVFRCE
ncbi:MAG TPA: TadE family protein [Actinomycetota bacterium]|nr:TadE family protein [Actinomycetota bacterium]